MSYFPQGILTTTGLKGSLEAYFNDGDPESFAILCFCCPAPQWQFTTLVHYCYVYYDPKNNLPQQTVSLDTDTSSLHKALQASIKTTDELNCNLTIHQKTLLPLHYKLGHIGMKHIQWLLRQGKLNCHHQHQVANCPIPKCAACLFGKMTKRPTQATTTTQKTTSVGNLKKDHLCPGQYISADQFVCAEPGHLYNSQGMTPTHEKFHGGTLFVDHSSGFIRVEHQVTLNASDTIKSKISFEKQAYLDGVIINQYHTDNGIFKASVFLEHIANKNQTIKFYGSGTPHQNGITEWAIGVTVAMAHTVLIHAAMHHPEGTISSDLW